MWSVSEFFWFTLSVISGDMKLSRDFLGGGGYSFRFFSDSFCVPLTILQWILLPDCRVNKELMVSTGGRIVQTHQRETESGFK